MHKATQRCSTSSIKKNKKTNKKKFSWVKTSGEKKGEVIEERAIKINKYKKNLIKHPNIKIPIVTQHNLFRIIFMRFLGGGCRGLIFLIVSMSSDDESMNWSTQMGQLIVSFVNRPPWPILINHPLTVRLYRAIITPIGRSSHCVTDRNNHRGPW